MSRSLKKGPFCDEKLLQKVIKAKESKSPVKTWSRSSTILPEFVGVTMSVHNGKVFISFLITEDMVGHKLGEFSFTHTFKKHGGKNA
jgi:small subunit ribosomal protein S19